MFKIVAAPTFPAVCQITRLGEDALGELSVVFRHKSGREHDAWLASAKNANDVDFIDQILVDWDACGEDGQSIPYSKEALEMLFDQFPVASTEIFECYQKTRLEKRTGN